ncbi:MAG: glycoside hydrolase family 3 N-terminal domain-containing protein [Longimicrobiaceae bacterium]
MRGGLRGTLRLSLALCVVGACSPGGERRPSGSTPAPPAEAVAEAPLPPPEPASAAPRLDPEAAAWVEHTLARMTLEQRIAQLVVPWISGDAPALNRQEFERMLRWVAQDQVGGLIISRGRPEALAAKLDAAQARARVPLLVVSDLETGPGMRLNPGGTDLPPAMAFGAADDVALAREAGRITGVEARAVGIHMTLGPVLDVNSNPDNPIINIRSFAEDPERVARLGSAWLQGARDAGLLSAGKHFPGHGDTEVDSHVGLATIFGDSARLEAVELLPFRRAAAAGMDGVLVGHIAAVGLEGRGALPASLSARVIGGLLRGQLGFQGLVFTDALNMGAITRSYAVGEASIRALQAGADVLLQPPGTGSVIAEIVRAVEAGRLPRERIDDSARRMLSAKAAAGLHLHARVALDSVGYSVGAAEHRALAREVASASITLVRDRAELVPFSRSGARVLHVVYTTSGGGAAGAVLTRELGAAGLRVEQVRVGARTSSAELAALRRRAAEAELIVATVALAPHQYRALGLEGGFGRFVEQLSSAGRPVIAVSLGSPYLLEAFPSVPTYLLGWSASEVSQQAVARALLGQSRIRGDLPVTLER